MREVLMWMPMSRVFSCIIVNDVCLFCARFDFPRLKLIPSADVCLKYHHQILSNLNDNILTLIPASAVCISMALSHLHFVTNSPLYILIGLHLFFILLLLILLVFLLLFLLFASLVSGNPPPPTEHLCKLLEPRGTDLSTHILHSFRIFAFVFLFTRSFTPAPLHVTTHAHFCITQSRVFGCPYTVYRECHPESNPRHQESKQPAQCQPLNRSSS